MHIRMHVAIVRTQIYTYNNTLNDNGGLDKLLGPL